MRPNNADALSQLRLDDILTFLEVYQKSREAAPADRRTFQNLFLGLGPHTTTFSRLARVTSFVFGKSPHLPHGKGPGFELLFRSRAKGDPLEPTAAADELYK